MMCCKYYHILWENITVLPLNKIKVGVNLPVNCYFFGLSVHLVFNENI